MASEKKIIVAAWGSGVFPGGVVHEWWNVADDLLELSGRAIPAEDMDRCLQALFAVLNASPSGKPSIFLLPGPRVVAASTDTSGCVITTIHSANRFPSYSFCRPHSGQISRRQLAQFPRVLHWCAGTAIEVLSGIPQKRHL